LSENACQGRSSLLSVIDKEKSCMESVSGACTIKLLKPSRNKLVLVTSIHFHPSLIFYSLAGLTYVDPLQDSTLRALLLTLPQTIGKGRETNTLAYFDAEFIYGFETFYSTFL
jgi:hypothetical protein